MSVTGGLEFVVLAGGGSGAAAVLALCVVPLGAALYLAGRASRARGVAVEAAPDNDQSALRSELLDNYERLRRAGQAVPLMAEAWWRLRERAERMPVLVRRPVAQAYHAIEVSNGLLSVAAAYDSRGQLSLRERRLALWPTVEAAVREGLEALGCRVTPAICVRARVSAPAGTLARPLPAASAAAVVAFNLTGAPRLTLFNGVSAPVRPRGESGPAAAPRPVRKKRPHVRPAAGARDGQMQLWESVA